MKDPDTLQNRQPAVAGQFYTADPATLQRELKSYFSKSEEASPGSEVPAIISPHAGYVFSGEVAAAAFNQVNPEKQYKTVFLLGCSHRYSFPGASVYSIGNYVTPLGTVQTDLGTAKKLAENKVLSYDPHFQDNEHSIEVQVPFLQYRLKKDFKIVPILLGTQDERTVEKIAEALKPYFTAENLFVISTDFSHYPAYNEAVTTDRRIADAIVTNDPEKFIASVANCTRKNIPNLSTGCCSWPSVLTLMYLTQKTEGIKYNLVMYRNSGDSPYGGKDQVVGYYAISISRKAKEGELLTKTEQKQLLQIARNTILTYLSENRIPDIDASTLPQALRNNAGAFVTLKKAGELRGCIGHFEADKPLYKIVQQMAVASSTEDYRFNKVSTSEMKAIDIEISVLTPMQKITDASSIRLGIDGVYIKKGYRSGTFLPQVATDTGWSLEEFLGHCSRDKAGIGWDGWKDKDTELYIYQAFVFGEAD